MEPALVSVVVPTYNGSAFIAAALDSVFQQTQLPTEIVVVDDASSDDTPRIVAEASRKAPVPVRFLQLPTNSGGPSRPLNVGIAAATSDSIVVLEQDDLMTPNRIASQFKALQANPRSLVIGHFVIIGRAAGDMRPIWNTPQFLEVQEHLVIHQGYALLPSADAFYALMHKNFTGSNSNFCFARQTWLRIGGFDEHVHTCVDLDFALKAAVLAPLAIVNETISEYRWRSGSLNRLNIDRASMESTLVRLRAASATPAWASDSLDDLRYSVLDFARIALKQGEWRRFGLLIARTVKYGGLHSFAPAVHKLRRSRRPARAIDQARRDDFSRTLANEPATRIPRSPLMHYRSVADLDDLLVTWLGRLPRDLEVIVGIPRSGLLVANLLSLHLNLPMTDVDGLLQGRMLQTGARWSTAVITSFLSKPRKLLVVDDSVLSGTQLNAVRSKIKAAGLIHHVRYAAPYVAPGTEHLVDFYAEVLPTPRYFAWNLMHHKLLLENTCMDIDGVLCRDPEDSQNDDGLKYQRFLTEAEPFYLPSHPVRWLVTSRLEKHRAATEGWLKKHGVEYGELLMMDYPDMAARRAAQTYASFKADIYLKTKAWLFIESSLGLARQIAERTGYDVFCMDTRELIRPGAASARKRQLLDAPWTLRAHMARALRKARHIPGGLRRRAGRLYRALFGHSPQRVDGGN